MKCDVCGIDGDWMKSIALEMYEVIEFHANDQENLVCQNLIDVYEKYKHIFDYIKESKK